MLGPVLVSSHLALCVPLPFLRTQMLVNLCNNAFKFTKAGLIEVAVTVATGEQATAFALPAVWLALTVSACSVSR
jgi:signal transduction histidine kinase